MIGQLVQAGKQTGRDIRYVEKLGLYYIAVHPDLNSARQLLAFAVRATERVPKGDDRVKFDHLFEPGDPENKRFWLKVSDFAQSLMNSFVRIEY